MSRSSLWNPSLFSTDFSSNYIKIPQLCPSVRLNEVGTSKKCFSYPCVCSRRAEIPDWNQGQKREIQAFSGDLTRWRRDISHQVESSEWEEHAWVLGWKTIFSKNEQLGLEMKNVTRSKLNTSKNWRNQQGARFYSLFYDDSGFQSRPGTSVGVGKITLCKPHKVSKVALADDI